MVNKRLDADGGGLAVVGDLLMRDGNVIKIFECQRSLAQGKAKINMNCRAKRHDMGIKLAEF